MVPTAWIYSIQFGFWPSRLHQHLLPLSAYHLGSKTYPLTPNLHWYQWDCISNGSFTLSSSFLLVSKMMHFINVHNSLKLTRLTQWFFCGWLIELRFYVILVTKISRFGYVLCKQSLSLVLLTFQLLFTWKRGIFVETTTMKFFIFSAWNRLGHGSWVMGPVCGPWEQDEQRASDDDIANDHERLTTQNHPPLFYLFVSSF